MVLKNNLIKLEKKFYIPFIFISAILFFDMFFPEPPLGRTLKTILLILFLISAFSKNYKEIMIVTIIFSVFVNLIPLFSQIQNYSPHDVPDVYILVKVATQLLLEGKNPYAVSYYGTEMDYALARDGPLWHRFGKNYFVMEKFGYPPAIFLFSVPFYLIFSKVSVQVLSLVLIIIGIFLIGYLFKDKQNVIIALTLIFLNHNTSVIDIFAYTSLIGFMYFFVNKNKTMSGICLGVFFASKQFAYITMPFLLFFLLKNKEKKMLKTTIFTFLTIIVLFLAWSPADFFDDTVLPIFCNSENCHPVMSDNPNFYFLALQTGLSSNSFILISPILMLGSLIIIFFKFVKLEHISLPTALFISGISVIITVFFAKSSPGIYYEFGFLMIIFSFILTLEEEND